MKLWIVFVRAYWSECLRFHYIDSQWASQQAALSRKVELEATLKAFGCLSNCNGASVVIVDGVVADAKIADETAAKCE